MFTFKNTNTNFKLVLSCFLTISQAGHGPQAQNTGTPFINEIKTIRYKPGSSGPDFCQTDEDWQKAAQAGREYKEYEQRGRKEASIIYKHLEEMRMDDKWRSVEIKWPGGGEFHRAQFYIFHPLLSVDQQERIRQGVLIHKMHVDLESKGRIMRSEPYSRTLGGVRIEGKGCFLVLRLSSKPKEWAVGYLGVNTLPEGAKALVLLPPAGRTIVASYDTDNPLNKPALEAAKEFGLNVYELMNSEE